MNGDDLKRELRGAGRSAVVELGRAALGAFMDWARTKPLRRLIRRRRQARAHEKK